MEYYFSRNIKDEAQQQRTVVLATVLVGVSAFLIDYNYTYQSSNLRSQMVCELSDVNIIHYN